MIGVAILLGCRLVVAAPVLAQDDGARYLEESRKVAQSLVQKLGGELGKGLSAGWAVFPLHEGPAGASPVPELSWHARDHFGRHPGETGDEYPFDRATGYKEGQIRGAVTIKRPLF